MPGLSPSSRLKPGRQGVVPARGGCPLPCEDKVDYFEANKLLYLTFPPLSPLDDMGECDCMCPAWPAGTYALSASGGWSYPHDPAGRITLSDCNPSEGWNCSSRWTIVAQVNCSFIAVQLYLFNPFFPLSVNAHAAWGMTLGGVLPTSGTIPFNLDYAGVTGSDVCGGAPIDYVFDD